jgi:hypothetical protein
MVIGTQCFVGMNFARPDVGFEGRAYIMNATNERPLIVANDPERHLPVATHRIIARTDQYDRF